MVVIIFVLILMISFIVWFNWLYHPAPPLPPCVAPPPPPDVTAAAVRGRARLPAAAVILAAAAASSIEFAVSAHPVYSPVPPLPPICSDGLRVVYVSHTLIFYARARESRSETLIEYMFWRVCARAVLWELHHCHNLLHAPVLYAMRRPHISHCFILRTRHSLYDRIRPHKRQPKL